jgi:hypothetical protein
MKLLHSEYGKEYYVSEKGNHDEAIAIIQAEVDRVHKVLVTSSNEMSVRKMTPYLAGLKKALQLL